MACLLGRGADATHVSPQDGTNALFWAALRPDAICAEILLSHPPVLEYYRAGGQQGHSEGATVLHAAVRYVDGWVAVCY